MGTMKFILPPRLSAEALEELEWTSVASGQDNMPLHAEITLKPGEMTVCRSQDESGIILAPWQVNGCGQIMSRTATLMERDRPYHLLLELARGKTNQVRSQAADWVMGGLQMTASVERQLRQATRAFAKTVVGDGSSNETAALQNALAESYQAADLLVGSYVSQVFDLRHQRQARFDTLQSCRLTSVPGANVADAFAETFNAIGLAIPWSRVEARQGEYDFRGIDAVVEWAQAKKLPIIGGPILDFAGPNLPDWLWTQELDLPSQAGVMADFMEIVLNRYRSRVRIWQPVAACNYSQVLGRNDEELLWLTVRLCEAARNIDGGLELIAGIAQPWGEYLGVHERCYSPFLFADQLVRSGLKLSGLDLEMVMGPWPRGSYCRDRLETSRLLDLYSLLGLPLQVTLGYPSSAAGDPQADPDLKVAGGRWGAEFSPEIQSRWADDFAGLALCKGPVRAVQWSHWSDAEPHLFPNSGLVAATGQIKPALAHLQRLRQEHLK